MPATTTPCPVCQGPVPLPSSSGAVHCPRCNYRFDVTKSCSLPAEWSSARTVEYAQPPMPRAAENVAKPPPRVAKLEMPPKQSASMSSTSAVVASDAGVADETESRSILPIIAVSAAAVVVLGAGVWLLTLCLRHAASPVPSASPVIATPSDSESRPESLTKSDPASPASPSTGVLIALASAKGGSPPLIAVEMQGEPLEGVVKPKLTTAQSHPGVDQAKTELAIDRGVAFLTSSYQQARVGAQALAGLTLLHCGRSADDPTVQAIARHVRTGAPALVATYELATCIMFLDRLSEPSDEELIRTMALQLIAGQGVLGGWNYQSFLLTATQRQELLGLLKSAHQAPARTATPALQPGGPLKLSAFQRGTGPQGNLGDLPVFAHRAGSKIVLSPHGHEDNSLTQFAVLALWCAQKHGVPAERSLAFVEDRFRSSQSDDGTWSYTWSTTMHRHRVDSMTCAGLLGLAMGRVSQRHAPLKDGDPAIDKALRFVGGRIGKPGEVAMNEEAVEKAREELQLLQNRMTKATIQERAGLFEKIRQLQLSGRLAPGQRGAIVHANTWGDLYYLWTLERVAVAYGLETIGGKDWYAWGAPIIVAQQGGDGAWREAHPGVPDTCFALLFLKRANVALDLTVSLQNLAISKQIGERSRIQLDITRDGDTFGRRPNLEEHQRQAAGYVRPRSDVR